MAQQQTEQVSAEGTTLAEAVSLAAEQLGVDSSLVEHKIDIEHFRSSAGTSRPMATVKIIAWAQDPSKFEGAMEGKAWLEGLIERMGLRGKVGFEVDGNNVNLKVDSPDGRFLVGRRGTTLRSIQYVLDAVMERRAPDWSFKIDVAGGRRDDDDRRPRDRDRGGRRDDDDRRPRDRDRDRDRGERRSRGRDRDRDRGDRSRKRSDKDLDELKRLATRLAKKARDSGESVTIRRELNSFERRHVHLVVAEIPGVHSESVGDGNTKKVVLSPVDGEE